MGGTARWRFSVRTGVRIIGCYKLVIDVNVSVNSCSRNSCLCTACACFMLGNELVTCLGFTKPSPDDAGIGWSPRHLSE